MDCIYSGSPFFTAIFSISCRSNELFFEALYGNADNPEELPGYPFFNFLFPRTIDMVNQDVFTIDDMQTNIFKSSMAKVEGSDLFFFKRTK